MPVRRFALNPLVIAIQAALLYTLSAPALAATPGQEYQLPTQPLASALRQFALDYGITLAFEPDLVKGKNAPPLRGAHSAEQGLNILIGYTSLEIIQTGDKSYTLRPILLTMLPMVEVSAIRPLAVVASSGDVTLPTIEVNATPTAETATSPVRGFVATRSATATKTDTPIIETPQSISVIGSDQLKVFNPQTLNDALGYTAGVLRNEGNDLTNDGFILRGFRSSFSSVYRDGSKYTPDYYSGPVEPYGLARIEVLKGAASVLYGNVSPGGLVNTVTKRPSADVINEVNVELGNLSHKQVSADIGGALDADGVWTYRLTALKRDSDTHTDFVSNNRTYIAPALKWQPSAETSLTLLAHYLHNDSSYAYGLPALGTVEPNINGKIPRNRYAGEPSHDKYDNQVSSIGYLFDHQFSDQIRLSHSLRYLNSKSDFNQSYIDGLEADERTTSFRGAIDVKDASNSWTTDTHVQANLNHGKFEHTIVAGVDYTRLYSDSERYERSLEALDLFNPVYGGTIGEPEPQLYYGQERNNRVGVYAQDQIKIDRRWVVMLGGRYDWSKDATSPPFEATNWQEEKSDAFTGRAGLVYLADNGLAPYLSFSQSFEPQSGKDINNNRFDPTRGEQYEVGVRYMPANQALMLSAAVYQLTQQNVLTPDKVPNFSVQTGEVRSRGFELEVRGNVTRDIQIIAAYAYTDARTTQSNTPEEISKRTAAVPYNQLSLWGDYAFASLGLPGLKAGVGGRYIGETRGNWTATAIPSYAVLDAMVSYEVAAWRITINASNLADKTYIASCTYACFYGAGRKVIGSVGYQF